MINDTFKGGDNAFMFDFRVYDKNNKVWRDNVLIDEYGNLYEEAKGLFSSKKIKQIDKDDYIIHTWTYLFDKNDVMIYQGDVCKIKDGVYGVVCYIRELGGFCILDSENSKYYFLGANTSSLCEVIGNCFDGHKEKS